MEITENNELIINGKKYIASPKKESKSYMSPLIQSMVMMASASFMVLDPYYKKPKERPKVDIITEFELIQQKKSKLSKSNRDWVENQFNKHFIEIK